MPLTNHRTSTADGDEIGGHSGRGAGPPWPGVVKQGPGGWPCPPHLQGWGGVVWERGSEARQPPVVFISG